MRKIWFLTLVSLIMLGSIACRPGAQITTPTQDIATYEMDAKQVRAAIIKACASLTWQATDENPTTIIATILVRNKHTVVVEIPYSATSYSINYVSSNNMEATSAGKIHPSYNNWVINLTNAINHELSLQQML